MQDLDKFKNEMNLSGKNVYVGHRYVPKIMGDWDNTQIYEPLSIVQFEGNSFTSRQYVPSGIEITNEEYWASTGNYNAQIEQYRQEFRNLENDVNNFNKEFNTQLAQTNKKIETGFVNVTEFGAVGDYLLDNGTVNQKPTDNTQAIQEAFNTSSKVRFAEGVYYIYGTIHLPKDVVIEGDGCRLYFESGGLHLGNHVWNNVEINNITISSNREKNPGAKGLYTENGFIVYPKFNNVYIYGFDTALYSKVQDVDSNFTWGNINNLRIEYCNTGIHLIGGWANTVKFKNLILNFVDKNAVILEKIQQFHNFVINGLTMEQNSTEEDINYSPFIFKESYNGEVTIYDGYIEANGYIKDATAGEKTLYMTSGTKMESYNKYADSRSWLLNGKIYSEDTNKITKQDIGNQSTFEFVDCLYPLRVNIFNTYITTDLLGLASFKNSPINLYLDKIHLATQGYSFPNVRKFFTNSTPTKKPKIKSNQLTNTGGGKEFNYDISNIVLNGDLFGGENTEKRHAIFKTYENIPLPPDTSTKIIYKGKTSGNLNITTNGDKLTVPETGVYFISGSFYVSTNEPSKIEITLENTMSNKIGVFFPSIDGSQICSLSGGIFLNEGDDIEFKIKNNGTQTGNLIGANNNVNYLLIKKINS